MKREGALTKINSILDNTCAVCLTRKQMEKDYGSKGQYARIEGHCNKECPIGLKLQELGKQLGKAAPQIVNLPRKQRREMAIEEVVG